MSIPPAPGLGPGAYSSSYSEDHFRILLRKVLTQDCTDCGWIFLQDTPSERSQALNLFGKIHMHPLAKVIRPQRLESCVCVPNSFDPRPFPYKSPFRFSEIFRRHMRFCRLRVDFFSTSSDAIHHGRRVILIHLQIIYADDNSQGSFSKKSPYAIPESRACCVRPVLRCEVSFRCRTRGPSSIGEDTLYNIVVTSHNLVSTCSVWGSTSERRSMSPTLMYPVR